MAKVTPVETPTNGAPDQKTYEDQIHFLENLNEAYEKEIEDLNQDLAHAAHKKHSEAPASVNFRMVSQTGLALQFTLRDDDEVALIDRLKTFIPALTEMHMAPEGGRSVPSMDGSSPAAPTLPGMSAAQAVQQLTGSAPAGGGGGTFKAIRLEVEPRADGKVNLKFFEANMKFPTINSVKAPDQAAQLLAPIGAWTPAHFSQGAAQYNITASISWVPSDKLNTKGNPYKNIVAIKPA